ncbi:integrase catalytic domain-containing protein [Trichonephila clavipes]|nr:integrase catalytic domain-containing protein [Trichonephila clavipes]
MSGVKKKRKIRKEKECNINSKYAKFDNFLISASSSSCASASSSNARELDEQVQAHPGIHKRRISDFLKEYKELGHMQEVDEREECGMYFIPHLGVYRSDKKQKAHICIHCGCAKNVSNDLINPDQRKLQRILWRENMDEPIKTFELSTVTYGTTSAPFLATRTLKQLALDEAGIFHKVLQL